MAMHTESVSRNLVIEGPVVRELAALNSLGRLVVALKLISIEGPVVREPAAMISLRWQVVAFSAGQHPFAQL